MVITDPKGEIFEKNGEMLKNLGYDVIVVNFRDPKNGSCWNPYTLPYKYYKEGNQDKATELLEDVSLNILYDKSEGGDSAFWQKSAADYFSGLTMGLFMDAKEKEVNLNSINFMSTVGEERRGTKTYIQEYFNLKGEASPAYIFASNTINAPNDTKGGILSTFRQKIRLFSTKENLSEMLSYSDFDMRDIGNKKTAVFMIIHDEKKTYHGLMTIFIKQCYETLIDCAQANGGKLSYRTNFILDEFANMPPLKDVDSMVTAARSRAIRFSFIIQNFAQLNDVYGEEVAQVIKGNCGNLIYLISTELKALEEISKMCGEVKSKKDDKTSSRPLITVTDLQNLKEEQAIILRSRMRPFKTTLMFDYKMNWGKKYPKALYPVREKQPVKLFDLKKFVEEARKKKIDELIGSGGMPNIPGLPPLPGMNMQSKGENPFMGLPGMDSPNPFMPSSNNKKKAPNLDDLVKRIDAKIAELEEEERREKEANAKSEKKEPISSDKHSDSPVKEIPSNDSKVNSDITDDQFFDDFFNDDN